MRLLRIDCGLLTAFVYTVHNNVSQALYSVHMER
jgi:hypothetical protein